MICGPRCTTACEMLDRVAEVPCYIVHITCPLSMQLVHSTYSVMKESRAGLGRGWVTGHKVGERHVSHPSVRQFSTVDSDAIRVTILKG